MRSLIVAEPGRVEWREVPAPPLQGDGEAIVTPVAASRCDYDRELVRGAAGVPMPFAIGHEGVARVVEVGDAVRRVRPSDVVVVAWHISCGKCSRCRAGLTGHCERVPIASSYGAGTWGGLFDDVIRVPFADAMLTPLAPHIDPLEATSAGDGLGLGHAIMSRQLEHRERPVAIFGRGEHALYQVAFAVDLGFTQVHYVDEEPERRSIAERLGAHVVAASPSEAGGPFDLIVDGAGNEDWLYGALDLLVPEGTIECLGGYFGDIRIPGALSYFNGAKVRFGLGNNGPHVHAAMDAVTRGVVRPRDVWVQEVAWDDLPAAYVEEPRKLIATRPEGW